MGEWAKIAIAISIPQFASYLSDHVTTSIENSWYNSLKKPHLFNTPTWIISPTQIAIYSATGYASYLVWRNKDNTCNSKTIALAAYGTSLAFNFAWLPICYQTKRLGMVSLC